MTRQDWIDEVADVIERTMPDEYPVGYARFLAEERAVEGYDRFVRGEYPDGTLWAPA